MGIGWLVAWPLDVNGANLEDGGSRWLANIRKRHVDDRRSGSSVEPQSIRCQRDIGLRLGKDLPVFLLVLFYIFLYGSLPLSRSQTLIRGLLFHLLFFLALLKADLLQPSSLLLLPCFMLHLALFDELSLCHLPLPLLFLPLLIKRLVDQRSSGALQVLFSDLLLEPATLNLAFLWRNDHFCMRGGRQFQRSDLLLFLFLVTEGQ